MISIFLLAPFSLRKLESRSWRPPRTLVCSFVSREKKCKKQLAKRDSVAILFVYFTSHFHFLLGKKTIFEYEKYIHLIIFGINFQKQFQNCS